MLESNRVNTKAIHGLLGTLFLARVLHVHFGMFWNSSAIGSGKSHAANVVKYEE